MTSHATSPAHGRARRTGRRPLGRPAPSHAGPHRPRSRRHEPAHRRGAALRGRPRAGARRRARGAGRARAGRPRCTPTAGRHAGRGTAVRRTRETNTCADPTWAAGSMTTSAAARAGRRPRHRRGPVQSCVGRRPLGHRGAAPHAAAAARAAPARSAGAHDVRAHRCMAQPGACGTRRRSGCAAAGTPLVLILLGERPGPQRTRQPGRLPHPCARAGLHRCPAQLRQQHPARGPAARGGGAAHRLACCARRCAARLGRGTEGRQRHRAARLSRGGF